MLNSKIQATLAQDYKGAPLFSAFDNASQTALLQLLPSYISAKNRLMELSHGTIESSDADEKMTLLCDFHTAFIGKIDSGQKTSVTKEIRNVYSLISHILPAGNEREAIQKTLKALGIDSLSEDAVIGGLPVLLKSLEHTGGMPR